MYGYSQIYGNEWQVVTRRVCQTRDTIASSEGGVSLRATANDVLAGQSISASIMMSPKIFIRYYLLHYLIKI